MEYKDYLSSYISNSGLPLGHYVDFKDKDSGVRYHVSTSLRKSLRMFDYSKLPDTIPLKEIELRLQTLGYVAIVECDGKYYALNGGLGGVPNENYKPTKVIINNPYLNLNKEFTIGKDCVVIYNDSLGQGQLPIYSRYASLLSENELSIRLCDILARAQLLLSASDEITIESAKEFIKEIIDGELGIIKDEDYAKNIESLPTAVSSASNKLTDLIEVEQYLKASLYNEALGLNANYNMKREAVNSQEAQMGEKALIPTIYDMLECRKEGLKQVKEVLGVDFGEVDFSSVWKAEAEEQEQTPTEKQEKEDEVVEDE